MANYTTLLKGIEKLALKNNIPFNLKEVKLLVKKSILPGEHISISDLKRKLLGAKMVIVGSNAEKSYKGRFTPEAIKEIRNQTKKAQDFYLTPEWKLRAIEHAGMTDKEAEAVAKFLSSNINRHALSGIPLASGSTKGVTIGDNIQTKKGFIPSSGVGIIRIAPDGISMKTPIHEAHHAAMLGYGAFKPSQLGVTDPDVVKGMNKFNKHIKSLGKELSEGIKPEDHFESAEYQKYITSPIEIRSRMLTGLTEGYAPNEIPTYIDNLRERVDPEVYANVAKKMLVAAPVGLGLATYNQE